MALSFDTPQTSTARAVGVTGTIPAYASIGFLTITLKVEGYRFGFMPRNDTFYREINLPTNNTGTPIAYHGTLNLSIVPKLRGIDTVSTSYAFSFVP